jgi:ribosome biogenesis GTPase
LPATSQVLSPPLLAGTILKARSGFCSVHIDDGTLIECQLRGRIKKERRGTDLAVIGDRVTVSLLTDATGVIEEVEPRESRFSRRQPGPRGTWKEDVLVANLDQVLIVFACADPMPSPRLVDRFLVVAETNEIDAVIVVNKVDLCAIETAREQFRRYEQLGYPVAYVSGREGVGLDALRDRLRGRISVVTGPSGVGKSTLLNALQPGLRLRTGAVSDALHKGRHTTTVAELLPLADGGYVADTPGLRELALWQTSPSELEWAFPEFRPHLDSCGFNDCRHLDEPRCAVRAALSHGEISPERYDSYRRILLTEPD